MTTVLGPDESQQAKPQPDLKPVPPRATAQRPKRQPNRWVGLDPAMLRRFREDARLTRTRLAELVGVSSASILNWERGVSAPSPRYQVRLVELMRGPPGTASSVEQVALATGGEVAAAAAAAVAALDSVQSVEAGPPAMLEDELDRILRAVFPGGESARVGLGRYLGWDGQGGAFLEVAGKAAGVSRERIRQHYVALETAALERALPPTPCLGAALDQIGRQAPCVASDAERELQQSGLARGPFRVEGLLEAARLLGRSCPFWVHEEPRVVVPSAISPGLLVQVQIALRAEVSHSGCATAAHVVEALGDPSDPRLARLVRLSLEGLHELSSPGGWLTLLPIPPTSRFWGRVRKALTMLRRVDVDALHTALLSWREGRMYVRYGPDVLLELAQFFPGVLIEGRTLRVGPTFVDYPLDGIDQALRTALAETRALPRLELARRLVDLGVPKGTVQWTLKLNGHPLLVSSEEGVGFLDEAGRATQGPREWVHVTLAEIQAFAARHGLGAGRLAKHLHMAPPWTKQWLEGHGEPPTLDRQALIADRLQHDPLPRSPSKSSARTKRGPGKIGRPKPSWVLVTAAELEAYRLEQGLSREALAARLGVSRRRPQDWIVHGAAPGLETQQRIRALLDEARRADGSRPSPSTSPSGGTHMPSSSRSAGLPARELDPSAEAILDMLLASLARGATIRPQDLPSLIREIRRALQSSPERKS